MGKSNLKLIKVLLLIGALTLPCSFLVSDAKAETGGPDQAVVDDLNSQIDAQRAKIDALTAKINEYNESIKTNQKAAASLKEQVLLLDNQIGKTDMDLALKEEQAKELQLKIDQTGLKIDQTEQEVELQKTQLSDILRLIARYEDKDYVSIILANDSFSQFFDQLKYSTDLQKDLQKTLNKIKESGERLKDEEKTLNDQKKELSDVLNKLESTKDVLGRQKNDKNNLISVTKQSEKKFQALVSDLKKEQAAANAQSAALEKKLRAELAKKGTTEKFNTLSNAILAWPTSSHRITATFHDPTYPFRALLGEHSGLDLGVAKGTPLMAAEAGYVAKVALGTKWYGNYIMIIHGGNITTLYAHLNSVNVSQDQYVTKGQIIGATGNTGFSSGPHLHFEVRSNGIPVDPLNYLP